MNNLEIQNYLLQLHQSLNIKQWIMVDTVDNNASLVKYKPIGKIILNKIQSALDQIILNLQESSINTYVDNTSTSTQTCLITTPEMVSTISSPQRIDHYGTTNNNSYYIPTYIGTHGPSSYQLQRSGIFYHYPRLSEFYVYTLYIVT